MSFFDKQQISSPWTTSYLQRRGCFIVPGCHKALNFHLSAGKFHYWLGLNRNEALQLIVMLSNAVTVIKKIIKQFFNCKYLKCGQCLNFAFCISVRFRSRMAHLPMKACAYPDFPKHLIYTDDSVWAIRRASCEESYMLNM